MGFLADESSRCAQMQRNPSRSDKKKARLPSVDHFGAVSSASPPVTGIQSFFESPVPSFMGATNTRDVPCSFDCAAKIIQRSSGEKVAPKIPPSNICFVSPDSESYIRTGPFTGQL